MVMRLNVIMRTSLDCLGGRGLGSKNTAFPSLRPASQCDYYELFPFHLTLRAGSALLYEQSSWNVNVRTCD